MQVKLKTSLRLLQDYFKTFFRLIQFNWALTQINFNSNSELGTTQIKLVSLISFASLMPLLSLISVEFLISLASLIASVDMMTLVSLKSLIPMTKLSFCIDSFRIFWELSALFHILENYSFLSKMKLPTNRVVSLDPHQTSTPLTSAKSPSLSFCLRSLHLVCLIEFSILGHTFCPPSDGGWLLSLRFAVRRSLGWANYC